MCEIDLAFKDFVLSRIISTRATRVSDRNPEADADWQAHVLQIGSAPGSLSDTQKKVVGLDYGMRDGSFLYYNLKRLGQTRTHPHAGQQIVLLNRDTLELAALLHHEDA